MAPAEVWPEPTALLAAGATRARITRNIRIVPFRPKADKKPFYRRIESVRSPSVSRRISGSVSDSLACLSARASAGPGAVTRIELYTIAVRPRAPKRLFPPFLPACFSHRGLTRGPQALRSSSCLRKATPGQQPLDFSRNLLCSLALVRRNQSTAATVYNSKRK